MPASEDALDVVHAQVPGARPVLGVLRSGPAAEDNGVEIAVARPRLAVL